MAENPVTIVPDPMLPVTMLVASKRPELENTWTLELEAETEFEFLPGQFNMLYMMGVGEVPISFSGDIHNSRLVHTIRGVGAVSRALTLLKPGDAVGVRGPYGKGWPAKKAVGKDVVVMAGGIGLAPLRPLLYQFTSGDIDIRSLTLLYGTRSPDDVLFPEELKKWSGQKGVKVASTVDHAKDNWTGHVGVVTTLLEAGQFEPGNSVAYICGPEIMMRFAADRLLEMGLPPKLVFLSMERNMKCAIGHCGHCQFGPTFICKDGPVYRYDHIRNHMALREF